MSSETLREKGVWAVGWVDRPPRRDDADQVLDMANARSQRFYGENQATREDVLAGWSGPNFSLEADARIVLDDEGTVAGEVDVVSRGDPYTTVDCGAVVHPRHENRAELWDWLHAWGLRRASALVRLASPQVRVAATAGTFAQDEARRAALVRAGFSVVRVGSHMRIDLSNAPAAACWAPRIAVRTADVDKDQDAILRAFLDAWRDHWGFVERPWNDVVKGFRRQIGVAGKAFDPSLWFLAVEDEDIVGLSLCDSSIAGDFTRGYVDTLGVRPAWRKQGIALALLHHTFSEFHRRGYAAVELDVDSQSLTGALRVYERAGMRPVRQSITYEKELRPGVDLATRKLTG
jgi:mycothiol synthase